MEIGWTLEQAAAAKGVSDDLHHSEYLESAKSKSF
jgi:hypothetical protein